MLSERRSFSKKSQINLEELFPFLQYKVSVSSFHLKNNTFKTSKIIHEEETLISDQ